MPNLIINNFSPGMNTLFDQRVLAPNGSEGDAESPWIENMDITGKGSVVTAPGYSLVSSGAGLTGGTKNLLSYEKDDSTKYLVIAHDDKYYSITPSSATWSLIGDYGTAATNVGGVVFKGLSGIRRAILGNDNSTDLFSKWDGTTLSNVMSLKSTCTMTIATPAVVTATAHGLSVNDPIKFSTTGVLPAGVSAGIIYYVISTGLTADQFQFSLTAGGAAVNTSGTQSGTHSLYTQRATPNSPIMEVFMGRLFVAKGATLYYTDTEDESDFDGGGVVGFNDIITGLKVQGESLLVFTKREAYAIQFYYNDSFFLSTPLKKPYKAASGCVSHKTATSVYNDTYYLSTDGVQRFGADAQFIGQNLRVNSLSWKINPSVTGTGVNPTYLDRSCGIYFNKKYYLALPSGTDFYNSRAYVYNYDYDSWTVRTGIFPSNFAIMPDSSNKDELYFASQLSPDLYKFTTATFDYNGAGYSRKYQTKIFTMGDPMRSKLWRYIDLRGSMFMNTVFYVAVTVDGQTKTYKVDSNNLERSFSGGFYGDDYLGDVYFGGQAIDEFRRYGVRIPFTVDIKEGRELQIMIYNSEAGQPWSVDYMNIAFDYNDAVKIPTQFQTANLI
ncbi:MAG: hypothetical protein A4E53_01727 [Pelotomaculum sp. PtaB.Bin104]|nr:MAG: hypothetical protein A4E53_01727 [Pelotomaculum sp. PtaB.Bin104]